MVDLSGHCLCGAVTFRVSGAMIRTGHCHCESCRRATSSPITSFFCVPKAAVRFEGAALTAYASSPDVRRGFCGTCGSPLFFETDRRPDDIDLYIAALDGDAGVAVDVHWHFDERVPWFAFHDDLPKEEG